MRLVDVHVNTNDRVFIAGQTGSGKTVLEMSLLRRLIRGGISVVIHDIKGQLSTGLPVVQDPILLKQSLERWKAVHYKPANLNPDDFDLLCKIIYNRGNCVLIVDEVSYYSGSNFILPNHKELLIRGRSRGIGMIQLSQRSREIHSTLISESQHLFCFQLMLKTDVDKLIAFIPQQFVNKIYTLPRFHYFYSNVGQTHIFCKPVSI